jgi:hypothetical protein
MPSIRKVAYTPVIGAAIAWENLATAWPGIKYSVRRSWISLVCVLKSGMRRGSAPR